MKFPRFELPSLELPRLAAIASKARQLVAPKIQRTARTVASRAVRPVRRLGAAAVAGLAGGVLSAIVKFGWEVPLPPRTPERNATNPPQALLEKFGMSPKTTHATYRWLGNDLPYVSFIVHFAFSIGFALLYCLLAEFVSAVKMCQGAVFGILVYLAFHVWLMPAMKIVPSAKDQPWQEHFSEFIGHIVWLWSIEVVRRDVRNRLTGEPDVGDLTR